MLERVFEIQEYDRKLVEMQKKQILTMEKDFDHVMKQNRTKTDKIKELEHERNVLKEQLRGFEQLRKVQGENLSKIEILQKENRQLKSEKKEMAKSYNKELQAGKMQKVLALKAQNDKYLNNATKINI